MREFILKNGIKTCVKQNKDTPRAALTLNISINKDEKFAGEYAMMNRLLLKGTTTYSSEELADILDENAIELLTEMKSDYLRFRFTCLNEDFEKALAVLRDITLNSTFNEFDKEVGKFKGELLAELDKISKDDVIRSFRTILETGRKSLVLAGDIEENGLLEKYLGDLPSASENKSNIPAPAPLVRDYAEIIKEDANQAQILQGWRAATIEEKEYPVLMLLNIILGASGLSSRLFLELREKKGLAYTVRTSYETHLKSAVFSIYIGTEPGNIQTSIEGFKEEIEKIKKIPVGEEELHNAKNNLIGKQQFLFDIKAYLYTTKDRIISESEIYIESKKNSQDISIYRKETADVRKLLKS